MIAHQKNDRILVCLVVEATNLTFRHAAYIGLLLLAGQNMSALALTQRLRLQHPHGRRSWCLNRCLRRIRTAHRVLHNRCCRLRRCRSSGRDSCHLGLLQHPCDKLSHCWHPGLPDLLQNTGTAEVPPPFNTRSAIDSAQVLS